MQAVMKQATVPVIIARTTTWARADLWLGAMAPRAPSMIPIEAMLAKPHRAYVEMTTDRSWKDKMSGNFRFFNIVLCFHNKNFLTYIKSIVQVQYFMKCKHRL